MKNLFELIDNCKYISFDIFDTAILRLVDKPEHLFKIVAYKYISENGKLDFDYYKLRISAEKKARDKAWLEEKRVEVTLNEIYTQFKNNIDNYIIDELKKIELETELNLCKKNEFMYSVYKYCIQNNKKVIFTTDMYLPLDTIKNILHSNEYVDYDKIYLSSELKATKSTGELFNIVLSSLGCRADELLHIGDTMSSDIKMAKKLGINTFYYAKCREMYMLHNKDVSTDDLEIDITKSIYNAIINNKYYCNRDTEKKVEQGCFWYDLGYKKIGILYYSFIQWLIESSIKDSIEELYFLSRDGYIMKKVYDILSQYNSNAPKSQYIYASRRAFNIASIEDLDEDTINFLVSGTSILTVSDFINRIGLNYIDFIDDIKSVGFNDEKHKVETGEDYHKLRNLYKRIFPHIKRKAQSERETIIRYLEEVRITHHNKIGIVDIGWHGSLQKSLNNLINNILSKKVKIKGYYLGTFGKAKDVIQQGMELEGYICNLGEPIYFEDLIKTSVEIFEFIHTAPHGSVIKFVDDSGSVKPIFDKNDCDKEKINKVKLLQKGALDFIKDFSQVVGCYDIKISKEFGVSFIGKLLKEPTYYEASMLGDIRHAEGYGDVYVKRYIARPPKLITIFINPKKVYREFKKSFWRIGFIKRMFYGILDYKYLRNIYNLVKKYK